MKTNILLLALVSLIISYQNLLGNGVAIVNGTSGIYLRLISSDVRADVNSQIAVVTTQQTFVNQTGKKTSFRYAFPLHANANAIDLSWYINGQWHTAVISKATQNDSIPGDPGEAIDPQLVSYLGETPLLITPLDSLQADSSVIFILKYVELLPYSFGEVTFDYPNDYRLIQQTEIIDRQHFLFQLKSDRTIEAVELEELNANIQVAPYEASATVDLFEEAARTDYHVHYRLSSTELGVYSLSTFLPDSLLHCDESGNGYVSLIIEPESNVNTAVIEKNFSLVIDRSGSMSGIKIQQAKDAAAFIVNHLNFGDYFNIVDFSDDIKKLFPEIVPYTIANKNTALAYINQIEAGGSTNISGALTTSIQQFLSVDTSKANIIIFLTDGRPTAGITETNGILEAVRTAVHAAETEIFLFTFGIGEDVNKKLLTLLALENNGLVSFLENDELEVKITTFFLTINNPVLLNTQFQFTPDLVTSIFPQPLPNLYKGQQLLLSGRYSQPGDVNLLLSGKAFNVPVTYSFNIHLADTNDVEKSFLPKIWAKQAIDKLTIDYNLAETEPETEHIQSLIDSLSICYGVISTQFTSFEEGGDLTGIEVDAYPLPVDFDIVISPDPFRDDITIRIKSKADLVVPVHIVIIDQLGRQVARFEKQLTGSYTEILCDSLDVLTPGIYYCIITIEEQVVIRKVVKM